MNEKFNYDFENVRAGEILLSNFQIEKLHEIPLLFQTGYLTIKVREEDIFILTYPNKEVKDSFLQFLVADYTDQQVIKPLVIDIRNELRDKDFDKTIELLNSLFANIPHQIFEAHLESYYQSVLFLTFHLLGYYAQSKVSTSKSRIDAIVQTEKSVFVIEFKVRDTAEAALQQIKDKKYFEKYLGSAKEIYLIGVSCQNKEIAGFKVEKIK